MARSKTHLFDKKEIQAAKMAKALAHPARVAIVRILSRKNECVCGEIVEGLPLAQATVSQHLKALKTAGIIKGTLKGPNSCYCIDWDAVDFATNMFQGLFVEIKDNYKKCC